MKLKRFIRKREDFNCENCGFEVLGSGYTNHCPKCLYSKHVDINPGDRLEACCGMMKPLSIESKGDEYIITHKCIKCGYEKRNKSSKNDDFATILKISKQATEK